MRRNRKMDVDELIAAAKRNFENEENPDEVFRLCEEVQKLSKGDLEKFRRSGYSEALAMSYITALEMQKEGTWDAYVEKCRHRKRRNLEE